MGTIAEKLKKLLDTKTDIKSAIAEKGQTPGDVFSEYPEKIRAIQTGIDTGDATAEAGDIARGKTAYVKGQKVVGNVIRYAQKYDHQRTPIVLSDGTIGFEYTSSNPNYLGEMYSYPVKTSISAPKSEFGDASPSDVAQGKTFTSEIGVKVRGTINTPTNYITFLAGGTPTFNSSTRLLFASHELSEDILFRSGKKISIQTPASQFGDATAADVAAGKTFTSAAGVKVVGTKTETSSGNHVCTLSVYSNSRMASWIIVNSSVYRFNSNTGTFTIKVYKPDPDTTSFVQMMLVVDSSVNVQISGWEEYDRFTNNDYTMIQYQLYSGVTDTSVTVR